MDDMGPPDEDYTKPCKCVVCESCWYSPRLRRCMYGGPFKGYEFTEQKPKPADDKKPDPWYP